MVIGFIVLVLWAVAIVACLPVVWRVPGLRDVVTALYAAMLMQEGEYFERV